MNILLIEDEQPAAQRLTRMVEQVAPSAHIVGQLESVEEAMDWWQTQPAPDLLFLDIHLADGSAFELLEKIQITCPIIFTTAYDAYAIQAFQHNSIDYLLKPIKEEALAQALAKYERLFGAAERPEIDYQKLAQALREEEEKYPRRLVIRFASQLKAIEIAQVAYFYIEERVTFLCTHQGKRYPIDPTLDQLESTLDPKVFYRINRQLIANIEAIAQMNTWSKSRIQLQLNPPAPVEALVSTERSSAFKQWLKGEG